MGKILPLIRSWRLLLTGSVAAALAFTAMASSAAETESAQLTAPVAPPQNFGVAVASAGDLVVVGDATAEKVYVYQRPAAGWSGTPVPIATLNRPADGQGLFTRFGEAVDIAADGSLIVVGAPGYGVDINGTPQNLGCVYVYP